MAKNCELFHEKFSSIINKQIPKKHVYRRVMNYERCKVKKKTEDSKGRLYNGVTVFKMSKSSCERDDKRWANELFEIHLKFFSSIFCHARI